jgi:predicted ATPase
VAEGGPVTFNPLFLYGGVGLGKTHLMHAIAHELQTRRPDLRVLYLSAEQFMYRFVQALRERQIMDFKELFRSVDVLMVDDVQFIAGKDSTQEEFFHTFNALVDARTSRSSSRPTAPRVRSRILRNASARACNAGWWSICTRRITSFGWASCSRRSTITAASIAGWCWPTACWSSWPTGSPPTSACWKAR